MKPAEQLWVDLDDAVRRREASVAPHYHTYQSAIAPALRQFEVEVAEANARFNKSSRGIV